MSKYKNPLRKYGIDAILAIVFVGLWAWFSQIEWDSQPSAMTVGAFLMLAYSTAIRHNMDKHER